MKTMTITSRTLDAMKTAQYRLLFKCATVVLLFNLSVLAYASGDPGWRYEAQLPMEQISDNGFCLDEGGILLSGDAWSFAYIVTLQLRLEPRSQDVSVKPAAMYFHSIGCPSVVAQPYLYRYSLLDRDGVIQKTFLGKEPIDSTQLEAVVIVPKECALEIEYHAGLQCLEPDQDIWIDLQALSISRKLSFRALLLEPSNNSLE